MCVTGHMHAARGSVPPWCDCRPRHRLLVSLGGCSGLLEYYDKTTILPLSQGGLAYPYRAPRPPFPWQALLEEFGKFKKDRDQYYDAILSQVTKLVQQGSALKVACSASCLHVTRARASL